MIFTTRIVFLITLFSITPFLARANDLHEAVVQGNLQEVGRLLKDQSDLLDVKDDQGLTPLHYACAQGNIDCIMLLIASGADLETKDNNQRTALQYAEWAGCARAVSMLLDEEADVNRVDDKGDTLLHCMAWSGAPQTVERLLHRGARVDIANSQGKTPIDYALQAGHHSIAERLKAKGVKPNIQGEDRIMVKHKIDKEEKGQETPVSLTILYDNYVAGEEMQAEWGFSCLIHGTEKTILFDTGGDPEVLMHNVRHAGVDLDAIDQIVISHNHWDHKGGLDRMMKDVSNPEVFFPYSFPFSMVRGVEMAGGSVKAVKDPIEICPHVYSTGQMGGKIKEQSLILNMADGLVIITGCSHQGIAEIVQRAKRLFDKEILLVFGGFHLMNHSEKQVEAIIDTFRKCGVKRCGATHCTGDSQIEQFRKAFGDDYIPMGVGRKIVVSKAGIKVSA